jgi:hypothetical protein
MLNDVILVVIRLVWNPSWFWLTTEIIWAQVRKFEHFQRLFLYLCSYNLDGSVTECEASCYTGALPWSHGGWRLPRSGLGASRYPLLVPRLGDVYEVAGGFPTSVDPNDLAFLMPRLEDVADVVLTIMPLDDILYGPSPDQWRAVATCGASPIPCERREIRQHMSYGRIVGCCP